MCPSANSDMIMNLPDNVIDQILIHLPIKDAVRTSVLSTKWRYIWTTITELVFYDSSTLPFPISNVGKLMNFIDQFLLLHSGFIHKFELSTVWLLVGYKIDCWIFFILRKNIKEFVLKYFGRERYKLPTCFFSAQQIRTLELRWCVLKPPPTFIGFGNLKSLCLQQTTFDSGGYECLISKCSVLERLTLDIPDGLDHLNIYSPSLKYLCLIGPFQDVCFENTPLLSIVSICLIGYITDKTFKKFLRSETRNVVKVLTSLPSLKKLVVQQYFLEFLAMSKIAAKLPFTCHHLNNLSLHLNFECVKDICVTLCLLNSSPNLRVLEIESWPFSEPARGIENFWEERTHIDWNMSGLQIVKITIIKELELELEFIKLLLANSPILEMLSIRSGELDIQDRDGFKILKELLVFPRASPKARIQFLKRNQ